MVNLVVSSSNTRAESSHIAALPDALLKLIHAAEAAVDGDRRVARVCLAHASALLLADQNRTRTAPDSVSDSVPTSHGCLPRWQANRLVAYIDAHLGTPIRSVDLIALTSLSSGHFFRTFKATFGEVPFAYIARRRIQRAQQLMLTTREPLCEIALACGLCDQSHLTRLFRRIVGLTPGAWRREHAR